MSRRSSTAVPAPGGGSARPRERARSVPLETIAAIATPGGRGGIGIVRVSGPGARGIGERIGGRTPPARRAAYRTFRDRAGEVIDRGIMLFFEGPASYTGEDVLELHGHGGRVVMNMLLAEVLALGARRARPGEFTERAFLNGKLDLVQAEAVADLVDSLSEAAARSAARSLEGLFSRRITSLATGLMNMRVQAEAVVDFSDEDINAGDARANEARLLAWLAAADELLCKTRSGRALREGIRVVIAGRPNVGKSSLLNRLAQVDRAIVDAAPGTTRDTVEEDVFVGGVRMNVVDTAGMRTTANGVEAEGVRRSVDALRSADLVLNVVDVEAPALEEEIERHLPAACRRIQVRNKIDLCDLPPGLEERPGHTLVRVSAKTGAGLDRLVEALLAQSGVVDGGEDAILARERHIEALGSARQAVARAQALVVTGGPEELVAEELRQAQLCLGRITGEISSDDLLGEIFSRFCIGK